VGKRGQTFSVDFRLPLLILFPVNGKNKRIDTAAFWVRANGEVLDVGSSGSGLVLFGVNGIGWQRGGDGGGC